MKITDVRALALSYVMPEDRRHRTDFGIHVKGDATIVRVETDAGLVGVGPAVGPPPVLRSIVETQLKPRVLGQDPTRVERLWELCYTGSRFPLLEAWGRSLPIFGYAGETIAALSGLDVACWDIAGQALGVPTYRLLGGGFHGRLRGYASGGWQAADRIGEQLTGYVAKGFRAVKMRVWGNHAPDLRESIARIHEARKVLGPDVQLMIDAHGTLDVTTAIRLGEAVRDCDLTWFEEPLPPTEIAGLAEVRRTTRVPIATGESLFTRFPFRDLAAAGAADFFQPDVGVVGGLTEAKRIATLAGAHGLQMAPHVWFSALVFAASLQLAAAIPNAFLFEVPQAANPLIYELCQPRFTITPDGCVEVPSGPGLGVTLDPDVERRFPYVPGPNYVPA